MNTQLSTEQLIDEVRKSLEIAIQKDKPSIVAILRKNGIQVDSSMGDDLIFIAVLKSIKDSPVIRKDITKYLQQTAAAGYSSYVGADATSTDPTTNCRPWSCSKTKVGSGRSCLCSTWKNIQHVVESFSREEESRIELCHNFIS